jgi:hypothetical protein
VDLALFVAMNDCGEGICQPCVGIDAAHFAGLDQRGNGGPVFSAGVMPSKEGVFAVQGDGTDRAFDGVFVDLDAAIG